MRGLLYAYLSYGVLRQKNAFSISMKQQKSCHIKLYDGHVPLSEKLTCLMCTVWKVAVQWLALLVRGRMILGSRVFGNRVTGQKFRAFPLSLLAYARIFSR